jgi:hypothetical protein
VTGLRTYHAVVLLSPIAQFCMGVHTFPLESVCTSVVLLLA